MASERELENPQTRPRAHVFLRTACGENLR